MLYIDNSNIEGVKMPEISRFYGMIVKMFFRQREHGVAHIHVVYGEFNGVIAIATGEMLDGDLPNNALMLIRQWLSVHRDELLAMWESQKLGKLPPLE